MTTLLDQPLMINSIGPLDTDEIDMSGPLDLAKEPIREDTRMRTYSSGPRSRMCSINQRIVCFIFLLLIAAFVFIYFTTELISIAWTAGEHNDNSNPCDVITPRILPRSFADIPVQDTHMHILDWSVIDYNYQPGTIHYHNWTVGDYVKATNPSAFVTSRTMFMDVTMIPGDQRLLQSQLGQSVAESPQLELPVNGVVTVTRCDSDLTDSTALNSYLDELQATVPLAVGARCAFPTTFPDEAIAGLQEIARRNLSFDLWMSTQEQLRQVVDIASRVPELTIIVDHMGIGGSRSTELPDYSVWRQITDDLALLPNVYLKLSLGLVGLNEMRPYVYHAISAFGYERCMYSSNWFPISDTWGFYSARAWMDALAVYMTELDTTDEEAHWILHKTAEKAYRLDPL